MAEIRENDIRRDEQALVEALTAPSEASMVDALLALPDDVDAARDGLTPGLQAALAAKMRSVIGGRERSDAA